MSSLLSGIYVTGAGCDDGDGEGLSTIRFSDNSDQSVLSSMQMMSSASIGMDLTVTGATGVGFDFFKIGVNGTVSCVISSSGSYGFCTWILNKSELV